MKSLAYWSILVIASSMFAVASYAQVAYQLPTVFEVTPILASRCLNDAPAKQYSLTGADANGNPTGVVSYWDYVCGLKVHSGRGGGITINAGCADVVWDPQGNVILVTPTMWITGSGAYHQPVCP